MRLLPALLAALLASLPVAAQEDGESRFRMNLPSPILLNTTHDPVAIAISQDFPSFATVGDTFARTLSATGGVPGGYTFSATGLPQGIVKVDASLAGTFEAADQYTVTLRATDTAGTPSADLVFPIDVDAVLDIPAYSPATVPATATQAVNVAPPTVTGGQPPYAYSIALPEGATGTIDPVTGVASVTATAPGTVGPFAVTVRDSRDRPDTSTFSLQAAPLVQMTVTGVNASYTWTAGQAVTIDATFEDAAGPVTTVFKAGSQVPSGLSVTDAAQGIVSGTLKAPGSGTFTLVFDDGVTEVEIPVSATVTAPPTPTIAAVGPFQSVTSGSVTVATPAAAQVGDYLIIVATSNGNAGAPIPSSGGFSQRTAFYDSYYSLYMGTLKLTSANRTSSYSVSAPSGRWTGVQTFIVRGATDNYGPFSADTLPPTTINSSTGSVPAMNVTGPGLLFSILVHSSDTTLPMFTAADPAGNFGALTERSDNSTNVDDGGGFAVITAPYYQSGLLGAPTLSYTTATPTNTRSFSVVIR